MSELLQYKGYHGTVAFDAEDGILVGAVIGVQDSLNYNGSSVDEITQSFHDCIDGYLEMCRAIGREPDKEYRGSFNVRISPELHRKIDIAAKDQGVSLNQYVQQSLEKSLCPRGEQQVLVYAVESGKLNLKSMPSAFDADMYSSVSTQRLFDTFTSQVGVS